MRPRLQALRVLFRNKPVGMQWFRSKTPCTMFPTGKRKTARIAFLLLLLHQLLTNEDHLLIPLSDIMVLYGMIRYAISVETLELVYSKLWISGGPGLCRRLLVDSKAPCYFFSQLLSSFVSVRRKGQHAQTFSTASCVLLPATDSSLIFKDGLNSDKVCPLKLYIPVRSVLW